MLQGISNTLGSLPVASIACTTTGLYIGRNFCAAAIYKIGSIGAKIVASKNASEWDQTSHEYLALAKKNGIRDLTAAAGLITIGLASGYAKEKTPQKEESSYFQDYGLPAAAGSALFAIGLGIGRKIGLISKTKHIFKVLEQSKFDPGLRDSKVREERFINFLKLI